MSESQRKRSVTPEWGHIPKKLNRIEGNAIGGRARTREPSKGLMMPMSIIPTGFLGSPHLMFIT